MKAFIVMIVSWLRRWFQKQPAVTTAQLPTMPQPLPSFAPLPPRKTLGDIIGLWFTGSASDNEAAARAAQTLATAKAMRGQWHRWRG